MKGETFGLLSQRVAMRRQSVERTPMILILKQRLYPRVQRLMGMPSDFRHWMQGIIPWGISEPVDLLAAVSQQHARRGLSSQ